jgi:hypothetical protein
MIQKNTDRSVEPGLRPVYTKHISIEIIMLMLC